MNNTGWIALIVLSTLVAAVVWGGLVMRHEKYTCPYDFKPGEMVDHWTAGRSMVLRYGYNPLLRDCVVTIRMRDGRESVVYDFEIKRDARP